MLDQIKTWRLWGSAEVGENAARDATVQPLAPAEAPALSTRRNKQKNLKASEACIAAFGHLAKATGMSEAELFEDMVAERLEKLRNIQPDFHG